MGPSSSAAMGKLHTISRGYRHGTRNKFSKAYRTKGMPGTSRYMATFKRGDYVDIVVDPSVQSGMPFSFYHGRSGVVFNVNRQRPRRRDHEGRWQPPAPQAHPRQHRARPEVPLQ